MMNIQKLIQDVFFLLITIRYIKKRINAYIARMDSLKLKMNHAYIAKQEKMEDQIVKSVNIL